jgi:hypothetical protein
MREGERFEPPPKVAVPATKPEFPGQSIHLPQFAAEKLSDLRARLFGERPTAEQLDRLDAMKHVTSRMQEGKREPDTTIAIWLMMSKWTEKFTYARETEKIVLLNDLYQRVSGDERADFKQEFPKLARRLRRSFRNRDMEDPEWGLPPTEVVARRIDDYLAEYAQ